jgi:hypothetical protein
MSEKTKVVQVALQQGTFYEVRDDREQSIAKFVTQAQANNFLATGVYPPGMMRSDRSWPL